LGKPPSRQVAWHFAWQTESHCALAGPAVMKAPARMAKANITLRIFNHLLSISVAVCWPMILPLIPRPILRGMHCNHFGLGTLLNNDGCRRAHSGDTQGLHLGIKPPGPR